VDKLVAAVEKGDEVCVSMCAISNCRGTVSRISDFGGLGSRGGLDKMNEAACRSRLWAMLYSPELSFFAKCFD
jgi:hypothetical protein